MTVRSPVEVRLTGDGSEIVVGCDLDFESAEQLSRAAEQCTRGPVTIDMSEVHFIDSTGVQTFTLVLRDLGERGIEVRGVRVRSAVYEVLELVGCVDVLGRGLFTVVD